MGRYFLVVDHTRDVATMGCGSSSSRKFVPVSVIKQQDSETSNAIIQALAGVLEFSKLSEETTKEIKQRDADDDDKLAQGIKLAIDKKVLPSDHKTAPVTKVDVMGKSADDVAAEIIKALGDAPSKGCVMTLEGLSGTGKGTTVAKLKEKLPKAT